LDRYTWGLAIVSAILASAVPGVLLVGYLNRRGNPNDKAQGIGWQFIRYTVLAIAIPVAALLALNDALTEGAAAIIAGAMGYAFAKADDTTRS
jgi:hypothetical protein